MAVTERRAAPRLDVDDQIRGELVAFGIPITVRDLGAGGFCAETAIPFPIGARQRFRFFTSGRLHATIEADVIHCRLMPRDSGTPCYVTGFSFVQKSGDPASTVDVDILLEAAASRSAQLAE